MKLNPYAFPGERYEANGHITYQEGMTLRDYFAAQCILTDPGEEYSPAEFAQAAYALADAMLAERVKS